MRYAIVSDIHANLEALTAVLETIDAEGVDRIVALGDLVGYGANPNECLRIIRERAIECIAGNHDRAAVGLKDPTWFSDSAKRGIAWTREHLTAESAAFLAALPLFRLVDRRFLVVHGALHPRPNEDLYLTSPRDVRRSLDALRSADAGIDLCFFGHTHRRVAHEWREGRVARVDGEEVGLKAGAYYLVNPGSVGQSRDEDPRAAFLMLDTDRATVRFHRVAYDVTASQRKAGEAGLLVAEPRRGMSNHWIGGAIRVARRIVPGR